MSSSISASETPVADTPASAAGAASPRVWRRFALWLGGAALGCFLFAYGFVVVVDPWGMLPLSPPFPRVPISSNARFSFPALARDPAFDSAIIGTSTARLLRPDMLNGLFGAHFVNLAMNAATAWEQAQILALFTRTHPAPRIVVVGVDVSWCNQVPERTTGRAFPGWMYQGSRWRGYREMANLYAVQEAANQFAVLIGLKRRIYGLDGYTSFVPPESQYDPARVAVHFATWPPTPDDKALPGTTYSFPALQLLAQRLAALPAGTRKLLFFSPNHVSQQGAPGSTIAGLFAACKKAVTGIAAGVPGTMVVDFMIPSPITRDQNNYWDPLHYRIPVADRVMRDLQAATQGEATADDRLLLPAGAS